MLPECAAPTLSLTATTLLGMAGGVIRFQLKLRANNLPFHKRRIQQVLKPRIFSPVSSAGRIWLALACRQRTWPALEALVLVTQPYLDLARSARGSRFN